MINLGEVVIFAGEPKDCDSRSARGIQFLGEAQCRERLINGEARPGKKADLLSGDDGRGARGEAIESSFDGSVAAKVAVLVPENFGNLPARLEVGDYSGGDLQNRLKGRRMGIKARDRGKILKGRRIWEGRVRQFNCAYTVTLHMVGPP